MLRGSIVALVTPMLASGEVDWASLATLVDYHVSAGTSAIVAVGTTGESVTLSEQEHIAVVEKTVALAAGRIPVIAGCGSNNTAHAIATAKRFAETGVVAGLSVTPYYNKPTQKASIVTIVRSPRLVVCPKFFIMCPVVPVAISNRRR